MAKKEDKSYFSNNAIVTKALEKVMHESMIPYSEFVIMDRALPRVEDGLKPVQRRVLFSMLEVGVLPDRPFRKSATIVGDCIGKYHPHGDKSIYDTMVRMAQPFNMGEVLVNGHGNFGSVDGDGAAAMRYTEAKLSPISLELLRDIEKDTVTWSFNFDDSRKEPDMLPGRFPNLLVNGCTGIAVGLATNIPPHNLKESCNLVSAYIDNNNITLEKMMKIMPAPDFPTGGNIIHSDDIKQIYKTGKGKIVIRGKYHIENADNGKKNIVFTELPYQVNKAVLLQKIAKLKVNDTTGIMSFVADIVDESDRAGMRAVIKLKKDANVNAIIKFLFKYSDLQTSFNANMVAIANGKPKLLTLKEILAYYVEYQQKIIYNRTKYDLEKCLRNEHILEALVIAIKNIDKVIKIIKSSKNTTESKITLCQTFKLTDVQGQAILDMRLARLTSLEVNKLMTELARLKDLIKRYTEILKSPSLQLRIVKKEINEIATKYGSARRCEFIDANDDNNEIEELEIKEMMNESVHLIYSPSNTLKTVTEKSYNMSSKDLSANGSLYEIPSISLKTDTMQTMYAFTNIGNCVQVNVGNVFNSKLKDKGMNLTAVYKGAKSDEKVVSILESHYNKDDLLVFVTKYGMVKISSAEEYIAQKQSIAAIKLKDDSLIYVKSKFANAKLCLTTFNGLNVVVDIDDITPSGRVSQGVKAIALNSGDYVVSACLVSKSDAITVVTQSGLAKHIKVKDLNMSVRNRKGARIIPLNDKCLYADLFANDVKIVVQTNKSLKMIENSKIKILTKDDNGNLVINKTEQVTDVYKYIINN